MQLGQCVHTHHHHHVAGRQAPPGAHLHRLQHHSHHKQQQQQQQQQLGRRRRHHTCMRAADAQAPTLQNPRAHTGMQGAGQIDADYLSAAAFLKSIGFSNPAEIARVLDIATNPNSLFVVFNDAKRSTNANARPLTAEADLQPVVDFLLSKGLSKQDVVQVITAHPPVLCYSVPGRLQPFWEYLGSIGVEDVAAAVAARPSLLGLGVDSNLRKIVEYLQYVETPPDQIVAYITKTI